MKAKQWEDFISKWLDLEGWSLDFSEGGKDIFKEDQDFIYQLRLQNGYYRRGEDLTFIHTYTSVGVKCLEYIFKKFFDFNPERQFSYTFGSEKHQYLRPRAEFEQLSAWEQMELEMPTFRRQYHEEIVPQLKRFEDLQELHDYDAQFDMRQSIFSGYKEHKRLILKKLLNENTYQDYKRYLTDRYEAILLKDVLKDREEMIRLNERTKELIDYIDTLDVAEYLRTKPWRSGGMVEDTVPYTPTNRTPIYTSQLSMLVIDGMLTIDKLSILLDKPLRQTEEQTAAEAMLIDHSGDICVLQDNARTIVFLQEITAVTELDWERISAAHRAMGFMIYEGATHTYLCEYWDKGSCLLSRVEAEGELMTDAGAQQEQYRGRETRAIITELFQQVAGRGLEEVYEDEVVVRYVNR